MDDKMPNELENLDTALYKVNAALGRLQAVAQGRVYIVGTKVTLDDKFGVVTYLNQGAEDPLASTVTVRLQDGTVIEDVSVTSVALQLLRQ